MLTVGVAHANSDRGAREDGLKTLLADSCRPFGFLPRRHRRSADRVLLGERALLEPAGVTRRQLAQQRSVSRRGAGLGSTMRWQYPGQQRQRDGKGIGMGEMTVDQRRADWPCPVGVEGLAAPHIEELLRVTEKKLLDLGKFHRNVAASRQSFSPIRRRRQLVLPRDQQRLPCPPLDPHPGKTDHPLRATAPRSRESSGRHCWIGTTPGANEFKPGEQVGYLGLRPHRHRRWSPRIQPLMAIGELWLTVLARMRDHQ